MKDEEHILHEFGEINNAMIRGDTNELRKLVTLNSIHRLTGIAQPTEDWLQDIWIYRRK